MLQAPSSESKQRSGLARTNVETPRYHELHPHLGASVLQGRAAGAGGESAQRERFTGWQRTVGNQAVLRMLAAGSVGNHDQVAPPMLRAKLAINQPGDVYEQEANRVAEAVMSNPGPLPTPVSRVGTLAPTQRKCRTCEKDEKLQLQRKESSAAQPVVVPPIVGQVLNSPRPCVDRGARRFIEMRQQTLGNQAVLRCLEAGLRINDVNDPAEREADGVAASVMAAPEDEAPSHAAAVSPEQRKCAACEEEHEKLRVQEKESSAARQNVAPPIVQQVLSSPGQPLDRETRTFMENRLGRDFGGVRIHSDAKAAESAHAVNALAYTVGQDIVFGSGQFMPHTLGGKRLVVHELAHVMQCAAGGVSRLQRQSGVVPKADWREVARRSVPYQQWTLTQQEQAESEREALAVSISQGSARESDWELWELLLPYKSDMAAFASTRTTTFLSMSATFLAPYTYESIAGNKVTMEAYVSLPGPGPPIGNVGFVIVQKIPKFMTFDFGVVPLSQICASSDVSPGIYVTGLVSCRPNPNPNAVATATYITYPLLKGLYEVTATYMPTYSPINKWSRVSLEKASLDVK